jgi:hypothetical protein
MEYMSETKDPHRSIWKKLSVAITDSVALGGVFSIPAVLLERRGLWNRRTTEGIVGLAAYFGGILGASREDKAETPRNPDVTL